jgi:2-polyprenyl-6-methoxyphenol hydroxylase-like FAD-dependent oxidoreductase
MFSFDAEEMKDSSSVSRWLLRNALLHKSRSFVKFGKTFQQYEKLPNGAVNVCFDDGSAEEFDLLVGADGVGSRVRNQLLPSARVSDSEIAVIYFKIPLTPDTKDLLPAPSAVMVCLQAFFWVATSRISVDMYTGIYSEQPEHHGTLLDKPSQAVGYEV